MTREEGKFPFENVPPWVRILVQDSCDQIVVLDPEIRIVYHNRPTYSGVIGRYVSEFMSAEQYSKYRRMFEIAFSQETPVRFEVTTLDGRSFHVTLQAVGLPSGERLAIAMGIDLSDKSRAAVALEDSERKYRAILDALPDLMFLLSKESRLLDYYASSRKELYTSPENFLGKTVEEILPAPVSAAIRENVERTLSGAQAVTEYELDLPELGVQKFEARMAPCGENVLMVVRNVTDRANAEERLQRSESRLSAIIESLPGGVLQVARDGRLILMNRTAQVLFGLSLEQTADMRAADFDGMAMREDFSPFPIGDLPVMRCFASGRVEGPTIIGLRRPDGRVFWGIYSAAPLFEGGSPTPTSAVVTFIDVSERKHLEEQLRQAQKMEAVGHLAGGVAHDFNNLLCAMMGFSQLAKQSARGEDKVVENIEKVLACGERAESLTKQLLAFSRKQVLEMQQVDLGKETADFSKMIRRLIGEHIEMRIVHTPSLSQVRADPVQIQQILLNLTLNARDAMPDGGQLKIETANLTLDSSDLDRLVGGRGELAPGKFVMLRVADSGQGISKSDLAHIFDPFFTTKARGKGTGLGLSMVYGIVKQHGGGVRVTSAPSKGSVFEVVLPASDHREVAPVSEQSQQLLSGNMERILLVEDEDMVRTFVERVLSSNGYEVVAAESPSRALEILLSDPAGIDLLLSDVVMPEMKGNMLYRAAREIAPGLKVLFMSGYPDAEFASEGLEGTVILRKPFTIGALLSSIRDRLIGQRSAC